MKEDMLEPDRISICTWIICWWTLSLNLPPASHPNPTAKKPYSAGALT